MLTGEGNMTEGDLEQCPYCSRFGIELIANNFDNPSVITDMIARCKFCLKKMRVKDYIYLDRAMKIRRGGRIGDE